MNLNGFNFYCNRLPVKFHIGEHIFWFCKLIQKDAIGNQFLDNFKNFKKGQNGHFAVISGQTTQRQSICRDFLHKKSFCWRSGTCGVKRSVFLLVFAHCALAGRICVSRSVLVSHRFLLNCNEIGQLHKKLINK